MLHLFLSLCQSLSFSLSTSPILGDISHISLLYSCSVLTANGNLCLISFMVGISPPSPSATTHLLICGGLSGPVPSVWSVLTHRCFVLPPAVCRNGSESPVCPSHIAECQALDWLLHRKSQLMLQKSYSSSSPDTELCVWCVWMLYFTVHSQWFTSPAGSCSQSIELNNMLFQMQISNAIFNLHLFSVYI